MTVERNIEGLRDNAQRKREETREKAERGIQQLIREKRTINFNTVAEVSGVSKAWLYKEHDTRSQIEHLRQNQAQSQKVPPKQKTSDASKDAIIKTLKERIKKIEAENRGLRDQHEAIYGRILQASEIEHKLERLEAENAKLRKELEECRSHSHKSSVSKISNLQSVSSKKTGKISDVIKSELNALGIELNSTLVSKIKNAEEDVVLNAIEALKEQLQYKVIPSPGGWLVKAIDGEWKPNKPLGETRSADVFAEWYGLAREQGIVTGSRKAEDDSVWVQENTGQWVPFEEFSSRWTIEYLRLKSK
ncbi:hypothetical protein NIES2109_17780 [Nostoc sp. HK-01]|nr:hypothetical protein NIES2109_17780 [Nostoc sp. HK-01]